MKLSSNTILITGGTSGIGFELALQLEALGNTVLVTGRDQAKLDRLAHEHPHLHAFQSDVSDPEEIRALFERVIDHFPQLNVLINNAGIMRKINLQTAGPDLSDIGREIETNLLGPVRMVQQFLPHLRAQPSAAIINVSSGIAFTPLPISPVYGATKAGLHSFTQALRVQLRNTRIQVFELAPPGTDTPPQGAFDGTDLKGVPMMNVQTMVKQAVRGFGRNRLEILPGLSKIMRLGARLAPNLMVKAASGSVDAMLAHASR